jgi:antitoxin MazE
MKARIIQIGNSRGVRIPKILLDQTRMTADVLIEAVAGGIMIRPARSPRDGWEESFRSMAARGDDRLLDETGPTAFDEVEWEW